MIISPYRRKESAMECFFKKQFFLAHLKWIQFAQIKCMCKSPGIFSLFSEGFSYYVILLCEVITLLNWTVDVVIRKWFTYSPRGRYNFFNTLRT